MGTPWYPLRKRVLSRGNLQGLSGTELRDARTGLLLTFHNDLLGTIRFYVSHIDTSMYITNDKIAMPYNVRNRARERASLE